MRRGNPSAIAFWLTLALGLMMSQYASAEDDPEGVLLTYSNNSVREELDRAQIHQKLGTKIAYRVQLIPVDFVVFEDSKKNRSPKALQSLCEAYLKNHKILRCELNNPAKPDIGEKRPPNHSELEKTLKKMEEVQKEIDHRLSPAAESCERPNSTRTSTVEEILKLFEKNFRTSACQLYDDTPGLKDIPLKGLSPFWAQEYIGADLAREFVASHKKDLILPRVGVFVFDSGFDQDALPHSRMDLKVLQNNPNDLRGITVSRTEHGTGVVHLLGGDSAASVSDVVQFQQLVKDSSSNFLTALDQMKGNYPQILNMSMEPTASSFYAGLKVAAKNIWIVTSAGNDYPTPVLAQKESLSTDIILVGSLSPVGLSSYFSSPSLAVTVAVPSDIFQLSIKDTGRTFKTLGGTSGATALVSGALANAAAFLPNLSIKEANTLLQATHIGLNQSNGLSINGGGMLNAYLLAWVAHRLSQDPEWKALTDPVEKIRYLHFSAKTYSAELQKEASDAYENAVKLLAAPSEPLCALQKQALLLLRKALLLSANLDHPVFKNSAQLIRSIYLNQNMTYNAAFYERLGSEIPQKEQLEKLIQDPKVEIRLSALRAARESDLADFPRIWNQLLKDRNLREPTNEEKNILYQGILDASHWHWHRHPILLRDLLRIQYPDGNSPLAIAFTADPPIPGWGKKNGIEVLSILALRYPDEAAEILKIKNNRGDSIWNQIPDNDKFNIWNLIEQGAPGEGYKIFTSTLFKFLAHLNSREVYQPGKLLDGFTDQNIAELMKEKKGEDPFVQLLKIAFDNKDSTAISRLLNAQDKDGNNCFHNYFLHQLWIDWDLNRNQFHDRFDGHAVLDQLAQHYPTILNQVLNTKNKEGKTPLQCMKSHDKLNILQILDIKAPELAKHWSSSLLGPILNYITDSYSIKRERDENIERVKKYLKMLTPEDRIRVLTNQDAPDHLSPISRAARQDMDLSLLLPEYDPKALVASLKQTSGEGPDKHNALYTALVFKNQNGVRQILNALAKEAPESLQEILGDGPPSQENRPENILKLIQSYKEVSWFKDLLREAAAKHTPNLPVEKWITDGEKASLKQIEEAQKMDHIEPIRKISKSGAIYTLIRHHPILGKAWKDPRGLIWSDVGAKEINGNYKYLKWEQAYQECLNLNPPSMRNQVDQQLQKREALLAPLHKAYFKNYNFYDSDRDLQKRREEADLREIRKESLKFGPIHGCYLPSKEEWEDFGSDWGYSIINNQFAPEIISDLDGNTFWSSSRRGEEASYFGRSLYQYSNTQVNGVIGWREVTLPILHVHCVCTDVK